jgi:hypothetical protein
MPAFDLALCPRMVRRAAIMLASQLSGLFSEVKKKPRGMTRGSIIV